MGGQAKEADCRLVKSGRVLALDLKGAYIGMLDQLRADSLEATVNCKIWRTEIRLHGKPWWEYMTEVKSA